MRTQLPGGATLSKRERRVLAWLRDNKTAILDAERAFPRRSTRDCGGDRLGGDPQHHARRLAWRRFRQDAHLRQKVRRRDPVLPKGDAIPQQVEDRGLVPKPKSDDERRIRMTTLTGAMTYIAAGMRAAIDIAAADGFDISHDLAALTSFYQGYDLRSWEQHIKSKKAQGESTFVAADTMPVWTMSHVAYLESVLGSPRP